MFRGAGGRWWGGIRFLGCRVEVCGLQKQTMTHLNTHQCVFNVHVTVKTPGVFTELDILVYNSINPVLKEEKVLH